MKINVIKTLEELTKLNLILKEDSEEFNDVRDPILSYIIASGNIINMFTDVPKELEEYIIKFNELIKKY